MYFSNLKPSHWKLAHSVLIPSNHWTPFLSLPWLLWQRKQIPLQERMIWTLDCRWTVGKAWIQGDHPRHCQLGIWEVKVAQLRFTVILDPNIKVIWTCQLQYVINYLAFNNTKNLKTRMPLSSIGKGGHRLPWKSQTFWSWRFKGWMMLPQGWVE